METIQGNGEIGERDKTQKLRMKSIADVLKEVEVLIDTHLFNAFSESKSSLFVKKAISNQNSLDMHLLKKTWRSLNCSRNTLKVIRKIHENLLCIVKRKELITKTKAETMCFCSNNGLPLTAKHIISCSRNVNSQINARHDMAVNILLNNNILIQRGQVTHEQNWDVRKIVRTPSDEITIGTGHWRSDEWKEKDRVAGAKLKPDLVWQRRGAVDQLKNVVVDVKVTSTHQMNEAFKEKDDKYRVWATRETREKKEIKVVMVPIIISHDGAVHKDTVR